MIEYDSQSLPTPEEFRKALHEASEQYDPVEELVRLQRELDALEQRYQISSAECYRRFAAGEMGDDPEIFGWVGRYRGFTHLKAAIAA
jgi:hypothetical protein